VWLQWCASIVRTFTALLDPCRFLQVSHSATSVPLKVSVLKWFLWGQGHQKVRVINRSGMGACSRGDSINGRGLQAV
jgi:hypothetical protein